MEDYSPSNTSSSHESASLLPETAVAPETPPCLREKELNNQTEEANAESVVINMPLGPFLPEWQELPVSTISRIQDPLDTTQDGGVSVFLTQGKCEEKNY